MTSHVTPSARGDCVGVADDIVNYFRAVEMVRVSLIATTSPSILEEFGLAEPNKGAMEAAGRSEMLRSEEQCLRLLSNSRAEINEGNSLCDMSALWSSRYKPLWARFPGSQSKNMTQVLFADVRSFQLNVPRKSVLYDDLLSTAIFQIGVVRPHQTVAWCC